ncbi:Calpain-C, partial [Gryllus bimaculatus]
NEKRKLRGWVKAKVSCAQEIRQEPRLFVENCNRFAVQQGCLSDGWFIAACAAVAERPHLLRQIVPEGQVLFGPGYDGSVRFRLWHLGEWVEVRVDDRLPVDAHGVPVYARCQHKDEFWLPLLEKAFAKFHKNYIFLDERYEYSLAEGLINLTGYCIDSPRLHKWNANAVFDLLMGFSDKDALMLCKTDLPGPGLPGYHAYTVTKVFYHPLDKSKCSECEEELRLVRVRNPWGTSVEWNGAWKDGDERWNKLSKQIKDAMEYKDEDDGEFWMDIKDFIANFSEVCCATERPTEAMNMKMIGQVTGHWSEDEESGGHPDEMEKFAKNPQFLMVALGGISPEEEEKLQKEKKKPMKKTEQKYDEEESGEQEEPFNPLAGMEAVVELLQEHNRKKRTHKYGIAFFIFETCVERRLTAEQLLQLTYVAGAAELRKENGVRAAVRLHPGRRYVVIPATERAGQESHFLLRVFSRHARVRLSQLPP